MRHRTTPRRIQKAYVETTVVSRIHCENKVR